MKLIDCLSAEEKKLCKPITLKKDESCFHEGEECTSIGIVLEGEISIVSFSYEGEEIVYNSLREGEVFGNNLLFSEDPRYKGDVYSKEEGTRIALISKNDLLPLLRSNAAFLESYLSIQSNNAKRLTSKVKLLSFAKLKDRLSYLLYQNGGSLKYKSITALSKELATDRETLSRLVSKMEKEGRIKKGNHCLSILK